MSRKAWLSTMTVLFAWVLVAFAHADDDTYNSVRELEAKRRQRQLANQNIWWEHLIPGRIEAKKKAIEEKSSENTASQTKPKETVKAKSPETASAAQQELSKALRREAICNRLREIAEETNDPELAKQADLLESRSWALYEQKVLAARLPKMNPMNEQDAEAKFLAESAKRSGAPTRAEANKIRSIPTEGKE